MTTIILYSNYSQSCRNLIQNIERHFDNLDIFKFLCIDNENIRKKILRNSMLKIKKVPSIIVVDNGVPHVLQGKPAFDYIEEVHRQYTSSTNHIGENNEPEVTPETPEMVTSSSSPKKQSTQLGTTSITDLELIQANIKSVDDESDDEDDVMKIARQMKKTRGVDDDKKTTL